MITRRMEKCAARSATCFLTRFVRLKKFSAPTSLALPKIKVKTSRETRVEIKMCGWRNCRSKSSSPLGNCNKKRKASSAPDIHENLFIHAYFRGGVCSRTIDRAGKSKSGASASARQFTGNQCRWRLRVRHCRGERCATTGVGSSAANAGAKRKRKRPRGAGNRRQGNGTFAGGAGIGQKIPGQTARRHRRRAGRLSGVAQGNAARISHSTFTKRRTKPGQLLRPAEPAAVRPA